MRFPPTAVLAATTSSTLLAIQPLLTCTILSAASLTSTASALRPKTASLVGLAASPRSFSSKSAAPLSPLVPLCRRTIHSDSRSSHSSSPAFLASQRPASASEHQNLPNPNKKISTRMMGSDSSKPNGAAGNFPKGKSDDEWRAILSPAQFKVLRQQGTEPAFQHEYGESSKEGVYNCAACDTPLYKSTTKFKSGCGWPAFFDAIPGAVTRKVDRTFGMKRIEIRCGACDSHLGHVFEGEGFSTPTDERHCVNGISLRFNGGDPKEGKM